MGIQNIGGSASATIGAYDAGTEASRPAAPAAGTTRFNTSRNRVEIYNGTAWQSLTAASALPTQTINYLLVGGGGGAGTNNTDYGGGGGGGGMLDSTLSTTPANLTQGIVYTVTVGAAATARDTNGSNTSITGSGFTSLIAYGGGAGGFGWNGSSSGSGAAGGSGGGAGGRYGNGAYTTYGGSALNSGGGINGFGNSGGNANQYNQGSCGGGGAGSSGTTAPGANGSNTGGDGGQGRQSSINGTATYYAGGGSGYFVWGGGQQPNPGTRGVGQSGLGGTTIGAGIAIITYPDAIGAPAVLTGSPTMTTTGTTRVYTFTSSGTIGF